MMLIAACTNTAYDTGDTKLSYLRTDFVEAQTNSSAQLVSAVTDNNAPLTFTKPLSIGWKTTADSICRVMLYYNMYADASDTTKVEPLTAQRVYTLKPVQVKKETEVPRDPVQFVSAWKSANGAYLNLCIGVMTGTANSTKEVQTIGLVLDSLTYQDNRPVYYLSLAHSQGNVPEYYTTDTYLSIPTKTMTTGSTVRLSLFTYKGWIYREFEW